jgi:hypothetical protein
MARLAPPPPIVTPQPLDHTLPAGTVLVRIFDPTRHGMTATTFRRFGPLLRFDHHRGIRRGKAGRQGAADPERGIYYAATTLSSCLVEVFGDERILRLGERMVAAPKVTRELRLLDLRGSGAMRAGSVAALAKAPDHRAGQAWSRYFYDEQNMYGRVDGLIYQNAHNDEDAIVLYERAEAALDCPPSRVIRLDDPALRDELLIIAENNLLSFETAAG